MKHEIVAEARTWLGTPFRHQARCKGVGVDCLGLVAESYKAAGIKVKDRTNYSRYPSGDSLLEGLSEQLVEIPLDEADTGDVLVMCQRRQANHVLIYSKETDTVIHSYWMCDGVVEQPRSIYEGFIVRAFTHE